jgi:hypothetical protein
MRMDNEDRQGFPPVTCRQGRDSSLNAPEVVPARTFRSEGRMTNV